MQFVFENTLLQSRNIGKNKNSKDGKEEQLKGVTSIKKRLNQIFIIYFN